MMKKSSMMLRLRDFKRRQAHRMAVQVLERYVLIKNERYDRLRDYDRAMTLQGALSIAGRMASEIEQMEKDCLHNSPALAESLAARSLALHTLNAEITGLRKMSLNTPDEKAEPQKRSIVLRLAEWLGVSEIRVKGMLFSWLVVVPIVSIIVTMAANHCMQFAMIAKP